MKVQVEVPVNNNSMRTYRSLEEDHPDNQNLYETDKEFLELLREVKIRFDTNPHFYQKEDYLKLIELIRRRGGGGGSYEDPWGSLGDWSIFDLIEEYISGRTLYYRTIDNKPIINAYTSQFYNVFDENSLMWVLVSKDPFTRIPEFAFYDEDTLSEIYFPYTVRYIGNEAFYACTSLLSVYVPDFITSIANNAFELVPNIVTTLDNNFGARAVNGYVENYLVYDSEQKTTLLACSSECSGDIVLDDTITSLADYCFLNCKGIDSITLPESLAYIGSNCFEKVMLTELSFEGTVEEFDAIEKDEHWRDNTYVDAIICSDDIIDYNGYTVIFLDSEGNILSVQRVRDGKSAKAPEHPIIENYGFDGWLPDYHEVHSDLIIKPLYIKKIKSGDLYFYLDESTLTAKVTSENQNSPYWTTSLTEAYIPESVNYYGIIYTVTAIYYLAFQNCTDLIFVNIPDSVTAIYPYAFASCPNLATVNLSDSVTRIESRAFYDCPNLTEPIYNSTIFAALPVSYLGTYIIPDGILSISSAAFFRCTGITSLIIPDSVTNIGMEAFSGCSGLTSVDFGNGITSLDVAAFEYCTGLTSIVLPDSVKVIDGRAFNGCSNLTSVTLGNSVTTINYGVFKDCTSLQNINIPNSVTQISEPFGGCINLPIDPDTTLRYADTYLIEATNKNLSTYTIKEGTRWIGCRAFENCKNLSLITIPNSVTSILYSAFRNCIRLSSIEIPNSVVDIEYDAFAHCESATSIIIPSSITSITTCVFYGCKSVTSINIPDSVTIIGQQAFSNCTLLTSVILGNRITEIDQMAFALTNLDSITIPESVTMIGYEAFYDCKNLTSVTIIGNGNTSIEHDAFYRCDKLASVTIGNGVTSIGNSAFYYCTGLTSILIPNSVTNIGSSAFAYCQNLESITLSNNITKINSSTFDNCKKLNLLILPDGILTIENNAFNECYCLPSVEIPNSVTTIGENAFKLVPNIIYNGTATGSPWGAKSINGYVDGDLIYSNSSKTYLCACFGYAEGEIIIPNEVVIVGKNAFNGCKNITSIIIPDSVTDIEERAFAYTEELDSVIIGEGVVNIGKEAFAYHFNYSKFKSITIPSSVTNIGEKAFYNCLWLNKVTCKCEIPPELGTDAFYGGYSRPTLYVPSNSVSTYKSINKWNWAFSSILPIINY